MRKEFKNGKAKHGLNSKKKMGKKANWHKAKHGLITKAKISFGLQNKKGRAQTDRRRGRREEEKRRKRGRRRREEKKEAIGIVLRNLVTTSNFVEIRDSQNLYVFRGNKRNAGHLVHFEWLIVCHVSSAE